jgi:GTP cyclohydrolase II
MWPCEVIIVHNATKTIAESRPKPEICYAQTMLPTEFGIFRCMVFRLLDGFEHIALVKGEVKNKKNVLCRIQSECLTSEVFGSLKCDCKNQLNLAMETIEHAGTGIILYLRQEGRGIGLGNKIRAYALQENGLDTVEANRALGFPDDGRDFEAAVKILKSLEVSSVDLMTNNPKKINSLIHAGISVANRVPHVAVASEFAQEYIEVKKKRMGHLISDDEPKPQFCISIK